MGNKLAHWKRIFRYEWKRNIVSRKIQYLLPVLIALQVNLQVYHQFQGSLPLERYWGRFLEGMHSLAKGSRTQFLIPGDWCLFLIILLYDTGRSSKDFTEGIGMQVLLRSGDAGSLWSAKCLVSMGNTLIYFASAYLSIFLFCIWETHSIKAALSASPFMDAKQTAVQFIFPVLAACVIVIWQMVISLLSNSVIGILSMCILLITSAYLKSWILVGNYLMKLRIKELAELGFTYRQMAAFLLILLAGGMIAGRKVTGRLDYIHAKGDM